MPSWFGPALAVLTFVAVALIRWVPVWPPGAPQERAAKAASRGGADLQPYLEFGVRVVITFAFGGTALYIILSGHYVDATQKWAYGVVGAIWGSWFSGGGGQGAGRRSGATIRGQGTKRG